MDTDATVVQAAAIYIVRCSGMRSQGSAKHCADARARMHAPQSSHATTGKASWRATISCGASNKLRWWRARAARGRRSRAAVSAHRRRAPMPTKGHAIEGQTCVLWRCLLVTSTHGGMVAARQVHGGLQCHPQMRNAHLPRRPALEELLRRQHRKGSSRTAAGEQWGGTPVGVEKTTTQCCTHRGRGSCQGK